MQELKRLLVLEQPKINAFLERHAAELPLHARPPAQHVLAAGGKRLRPFLTLLTGRALGIAPDRAEGLYVLGAAVEMLHAATLLHDDILDNAALRRGRPAAHTLFGVAPVILAGDALLAKALLMVSGFGAPRLTGCISEAVMRTAEGEIAEFTLLRDPKVSHEAYLEVVTGKTAWMLRAACELGALWAGAAGPAVEAAARFGLELGVAFQMVDDALDYASPEQTGKPRGGDLREGKVTPPLLFYHEALERRDPRQAAEFTEKLRSDGFSREELEAISLQVDAQGHGQKTRDLAEKHLQQAAIALAEFPEGRERKVLEAMLGYIRSRDK